MSLSFSVAKRTLDLIAQDISRARQQLDMARDNLATPAANLAAMPQQHSAFVAAIDAEAAANPDSDAWALAKSEKDELVAEFQALLTRAEALLAAYDAT